MQRRRRIGCKTVARVKCSDRDEVTIYWYNGTKTTPWTLAFKSTENGGILPWETKVAARNIYYSGFDLTPTGKLPIGVQRISDEFKAMYNVK